MTYGPTPIIDMPHAAADFMNSLIYAISQREAKKVDENLLQAFMSTCRK